MDYKTCLINNVLSETNIQYMVNLLINNFTVNKSAFNKCNKNINRNNSRDLTSTIKNEERTDSITNQNMIIISEDEKIKILESYSMNTNFESNKSLSSDMFLEYLTNPSVLQMFQLMINQLNQ